MSFLEESYKFFAKNSNFAIFESALYMKSVSMPLNIISFKAFDFVFHIRIQANKLFIPNHLYNLSFLGYVTLCIKGSPR